MRARERNRETERVREGVEWKERGGWCPGAAALELNPGILSHLLLCVRARTRFSLSRDIRLIRKCMRECGAVSGGENVALRGGSSVRETNRE